MPLNQNELSIIEKIYCDKIKTRWEYFDKNAGRFYTKIIFTSNPKPKGRQISAWRLETMIGRKLKINIPGGLAETCDHIDGNKLNDSCENLQVLTRADNQRKSIIQNNLRGENTHSSKLNDFKVFHILCMKNFDNVSTKHLTSKFNMSRQCIEGITNNIYWLHIPRPTQQTFFNHLHLQLQTQYNPKFFIRNDENISQLDDKKFKFDII